MMSALALALMLSGPQDGLPAELSGEQTWRIVVETPAMSFAVMEAPPLRGAERAFWVWVTLAEPVDAGEGPFRQGWINYEVDCATRMARLAEGGDAASTPAGPPSALDQAGRVRPPMARRSLEPIQTGTPLAAATNGVCDSNFGAAPAVTGDWEGVRATLLARMDASQGR